MKQVLGSKKGTEETSMGTEKKGLFLCNGGYDSTCDGLGLGSERVQTSKTYRIKMQKEYVIIKYILITITMCIAFMVHNAYSVVFSCSLS